MFDQKGNIIFFLPLIIILILLISGLIIFFSPKFGQNTQQFPVSTPHPVASVKSDFLKKQFTKEDKILNKIDYPLELTSLPEKDLVGLNCSLSYEKQVDLDTKTYKYLMLDKKNNKYLKADNLEYIDLIDTINQTIAPKEVRKIIFCKAENGKLLVGYQTSLKENFTDPQNIFYAFTDKAQIAKIYVQINNENNFYSDCLKPLLLTSSNNLYVECKSEDGGYSHTSIYKLNLTGSRLEQILKCELPVNVQNPNLPTCQTFNASSEATEPELLELHEKVVIATKNEDYEALLKLTSVYYSLPDEAADKEFIENGTKAKETDGKVVSVTTLEQPKISYDKPDVAGRYAGAKISVQREKISHVFAMLYMKVATDNKWYLFVTQEVPN